LNDLAISLIDRIKHLIHNKNPSVTFGTKETIIELNGVRIEVFPSHNLDALFCEMNNELRYLGTRNTDTLGIIFHDVK
jgi:hypothetical protein